MTKETRVPVEKITDDVVAEVVMNDLIANEPLQKAKHLLGMHLKNLQGKNLTSWHKEDGYSYSVESGLQHAINLYSYYTDPRSSVFGSCGLPVAGDASGFRGELITKINSFLNTDHSQQQEYLLQVKSGGKLTSASFSG